MDIGSIGRCRWGTRQSFLALQAKCNMDGFYLIRIMPFTTNAIDLMTLDELDSENDSDLKEAFDSTDSNQGNEEP